MEDRFIHYYSLVDIYNLKNKGKYIVNLDDKQKEIFLFFSFAPINFSILMRYIEYITKDMCQKLITKENVEKEIQQLKNFKSDNDYNWKDISFIKLLEADYNYLVEKFILKKEIVPDNNFFIKNFSYPGDTYVYPFSIKEFYNMALNRAIYVCINNYYLSNKK